MKKIVPKLLVISSQLLIGALFLIITINTKSEINLKVNSKEMEKLSQFVYVGDSNKVKNNVDNKDKVVYKEEIKSEVIKESKKEEKTKEEIVVSSVKEEVVVKKDNFFMDREVLSTYTGILTGYGPDCVGCGNFNTNKVSTASGYHIADIVDGSVQPAFNVTYEDSEYGKVRVVAGDSTLPFNTIVRITIPGEDPIMAIVLDRGSTVGFDNCRSSKGCLTNFDLLFASEKDAIGKTQNVKFEILRMGA